MLTGFNTKLFVRGLLAFLVLAVSAFLPMQQTTTTVASAIAHPGACALEHSSDDHTPARIDIVAGYTAFHTPALLKLKMKSLARRAHRVFFRQLKQLIVPIRLQQMLFRARDSILKPGYYLFLFRYTLF